MIHMIDPLMSLNGVFKSCTIDNVTTYNEENRYMNRIFVLIDNSNLQL